MPHTLFGILIVLFCFPLPAWSFQEHGGPEGLHAHQMAHTFFAFSMGLLIYWLRKRRLVAVQGWRFIQYAAILFVLWNINAFAGHWLEELSGLIDTRRVGLMNLRMVAADGYEWLIPVFYVLKLDHLLCVPALFFLYIGLRRLLHAPAQAEEG